MIGLVRKHLDEFLTCVPVDSLTSLPHHRQAVVGTRRRGGDRRLALLRGSRKQAPARNSSLTGNGKQSRTQESGPFSLP